MLYCTTDDVKKTLKLLQNEIILIGDKIAEVSKRIESELIEYNPPFLNENGEPHPIVHTIVLFKVSYELYDENIRKANIKETNVKNTDYWLSESNRLLSEIKKGLIKLKKEEFFASCPTISIINFTERKFY